MHATYRTVWKEVMDLCKEAWPQFEWSERLLVTNYDTERRPFQMWKMLMEYSGVTFNRVTNLPSLSEATWEQFLRRNSTPSKFLTWLRTILLGDVDVYKADFFESGRLDVIFVRLAMPLTPKTLATISRRCLTTIRVV